MIHFVDAQTEPELTRDERESFNKLFADNDDPSQRHRIPIRAWQDGKLVKAFFEEPSDNITTTLFTELAPLFFRSQIVPYCQCHIQYHRLILAKQQIDSAVTSLQITTHLLLQLKDQIPRTVWQRLKELRGQTFFSQYDLADAIVELLQPILTESQVQDHGEVILNAMKQVGINDDVREKRLAQLRYELDIFHDHAPVKPYPPVKTPCPFCHSPYRYTIVELLATQPNVLDRIKTLIIGEVTVPFRDLERILVALEIWLFHHHDADLFTKKKTMVGTMLQMLHQGYQTIMTNLPTSERSVNEADSDDSVLNSGASLPPPPPVPILDGNLTSTSTSGLSEN